MAVFRFMVNVDKCVDMSHYKCFFYKLKGYGDGKQSLFHLSEAQLLEGDPGSLGRAVRDIRMYLDKYPYEVEDYRIIIVMRCPFSSATQQWEQTVLYRLLRLRYEFQKSHILLSTAAEAERDNALNLVMLYDADFAAGMPELTSYFSSRRFTEDVKLLLQKYGAVEGECDMPRIKEALEKTHLQPESTTPDSYLDPHEADVLLRYIATYENISKELQSSSEDVALFPAFAKELLNNYGVYERFVNRSDRREETLTLLRVTEFINHDTAPQENEVSTLTQRCDAAWKQIWSDTGAKERYAAMLASYKRKLDSAYGVLENPVFPLDVNTNLPPVEVPGVDAIFSADNILEQEEGRHDREDVLKKLRIFAKRKLFLKNFREEWNRTYGEILKVLDNLKRALRIYAQDLSDQYADVLAERKKLFFAWKNANFVAESREKERLEVMGDQKAEHLRCLKEPHMNPSLSFQDVLNSERELDQANRNICFYLDCMKATAILNFMLFAAVCGGFFVLHYTLLQPYALAGVDTLLYYLGYIGAAVVLMGFAFGVPYRHYKKLVQGCLGTLATTLSAYIKGYYEKGKYFSEYINHMNCLDYLTRQYDLVSDAMRRGRDLKMGQQWHRDQIGQHREMLGYFSGLIESAPSGNSDVTVTTVDVVSGGRVREVAECPIYWPQD